jgi:class 3 adenylate cyclase
VFALALRDRVASTDWVAKGFRRPLSLRTGLHVGPVYKCHNPVTGREDYLGTHVSPAARIEPITPKGQVYASEVFAAIAFAERVGAFTCAYVGQIGLAKEYGTYPTYHVRRRGG